MPIEKFQNKYTIKSARLQGYDYSQNGMYFVTICTREKEHFFGEVVEEKMILSGIGKIAKRFWREIPAHFPFVIPDEFIVMPNHIHGIIEIHKAGRDEAMPRLYDGLHKKMSAISPKPGSLPVIIGAYKSIVSKAANKIENRKTLFHWQSRYYDHIIRSEDSLNKIREYIIKNPRIWERDRNNSENLLM